MLDEIFEELVKVEADENRNIDEQVKEETKKDIKSKVKGAIRDLSDEKLEEMWKKWIGLGHPRPEEMAKDLLDLVMTHWGYWSEEDLAKLYTDLGVVVIESKKKKE